MIRNIVEHIGGVGLYGLISMLLFFVSFTGMVWWACCLKKPYLSSMGQLPLDHETDDQEKGVPGHG